MWITVAIAALWLVATALSLGTHRRMGKPIPGIWKALIIVMGIFFLYEIVRWIV